jgi:hypothetical protein
MQERNSIQQDFEGNREDLLKQYQSGDISKSLYDSETEALQDALNKRLEIQRIIINNRMNYRMIIVLGLFLVLQRRLLLQWICTPQCNRLVRKHSAA